MVWNIDGNLKIICVHRMINVKIISTNIMPSSILNVEICRFAIIVKKKKKKTFYKMLQLTNQGCVSQ